MTRLNLRPYQPGDLPAASTVGVSVIVLTRDESVNIERCLSSVRWAAQLVVVDSGSTDDTVARAAAAGAEVVVEPWRGYAAQREFALRLPLLRHEWAYFVDADEWVSSELASEVARVVTAPSHDAYGQRFRLVFQGRWIRHCGWYKGSSIVRLVRRSKVRFGHETFGERLQVSTTVGRLRHDLVDADAKGLACWLRKHVGYAELEAVRRGDRMSLAARWRSFRRARAFDSRPLPRAIAKELVFPLVPSRPLALFLYMYVLKLGFLDGVAGLRFCVYHAWFQMTVDALRCEATLHEAPPADGGVRPTNERIPAMASTSPHRTEEYLA
jgi:glycosyltransferase involved in cell wall biosynthesis